MIRRLDEVPSLLIALAAGGAWYFAGSRMAWRLGADDAAPAIGLLIALAVALTLWRRHVTDDVELSLQRLVCPRCRGRLEVAHEHAGEAHPAGLQLWTCAGCDYAHALALTCEECAR